MASNASLSRCHQRDHLNTNATFLLSQVGYTTIPYCDLKSNDADIGNLFCPAVGDQISGADGGAPADFDPYDDCTTSLYIIRTTLTLQLRLVTVVNLQDAFERREERPQINDVADITSFSECIYHKCYTEYFDKHGCFRHFACHQ